MLLAVIDQVRTYPMGIGGSAAVGVIVASNTVDAAVDDAMLDVEVDTADAEVGVINGAPDDDVAAPTVDVDSGTDFSDIPMLDADADADVEVNADAEVTAAAVVDVNVGVDFDADCDAEDSASTIGVDDDECSSTGKVT